MHQMKGDIDSHFQSIRPYYFGTKRLQPNYAQFKNRQLHLMLASLNTLQNSAKRISADVTQKSLKKCFRKCEKIEELEHILTQKSNHLWKKALKKAAAAKDQAHLKQAFTLANKAVELKQQRRRRRYSECLESILI